MRPTRVIAAVLAAGLGGGSVVVAMAAARSSGTIVTGPGTGLATTITGTVVSPAQTTPGGTGLPTVPRAELTHPRVRPRVGDMHTSFTLWFTLREAPGHAGVLATDYRVQVSPPSHARMRCWPAPRAPIQVGRKGETVRLRLAPPSAGWCAAQYTVTVYLQRGPYCPPPVAGKPPAPCPEFATQELDVGAAHFTVH